MGMNHDAILPPCDIRIDKEGTWYYQGAEMFRRDIVNYFYENLKRDDGGHYLIEIDDDRCYLEVEDTAFVVKAVDYIAATEGGNEAYIALLLSDDTVERLDSETLRITSNEVPYCKVKARRFDARFSRAGYYQLTRFLEYDPVRESYYISLTGNRCYIRRYESDDK